MMRGISDIFLSVTTEFTEWYVVSYGMSSPFMCTSYKILKYIFCKEFILKNGHYYSKKTIIYNEKVW